MSDEKKLTLSSRGTLGAGKGAETGKVRQSFSHGRSKQVVVERRRKRVLKKGTQAPAAETAPQQSAPAAPRPAADKPVPFKPKRSDKPAGGLTKAELEARAEALKRAEVEAKKREEDERRRREEEALRRAAEAEARAREAESQRQEEAEAQRQAEEAARRAAEDKARKKQEAEARKKAEDEARRQQEAEEAKKRAERAKAAARAAQTPQPEAEESERRRPARPGRGPAVAEVKKPARGARKGGDQRRSGKLTVTRALEGGDEERQRSVAAFRRAQQKRHRAQRGGDQGAQERQSREVVVPEAITVQELAQRMAEKAPAVIKALMKMGVMATINQTLDQDTAELVVEEFGHRMKRVSEADVEVGLFGEEDSAEAKQPRPPVVAVMGHVDHGKTSLLDALRQSDVVAGEAGGITQHIGAYQVSVDGGQKITFLDTPGHEAFTQMRARGAGVTDLVILVVAADDGIMPQTIEAINHVKAAGVPMIVAINKIDKEGANPDRVRNELLQHEIVVEGMGGDVQDVEVSALKKQNLDGLREAILLQAEIMELAANPDRSAEGTVIEAQLDKGRGPVATVLIKRGTLRVGDIFVSGAEWGKVRALIDDHGRQIKEAGPAQPVEILGLNGVPSAGDDFAVVESEGRAREITEYRQAQVKKKKVGSGPASLESMFTALKEKQAIEFPVVLKADVQGSAEAITQALEQAGNEDIQARVLHAAVGGITESDVTLAKASGALILGFNTRPNRQARDAAERDDVPIHYYSVIYDLVDDIKQAMAGQLSPEIREEALGKADILQVFPAGKGKAAGCLVTEGVVRVGAHVRIIREDVVKYKGKIASLRRFKDDVKEVQSGTECGMTFENFIDIDPGDELECFLEVEKKREL
ncbi:MAG: translation initiation factor IF-2 [Rhodothalassiaceae bacterium]